MLPRSWSEAENTFLFVLNPAREKRAKITAKLILQKLLGMLTTQFMLHDFCCWGKTPLQRVVKGSSGSCLRIMQSPLGRAHFLLSRSFSWANLPRVLSSSRLLLNTLVPGNPKWTFLPVTIGSRLFPYNPTAASHLSEKSCNSGTTGSPTVHLFQAPQQQFHLVQANTLTVLPILLPVSTGPGVPQEVRALVWGLES